MINRLFSEDSLKKKRSELLRQGFVVDAVPYFALWGRAPKTIAWVRGKQYSKKPEGPTLWVAITSLKPLSPPVFTPFQAYPCSKSAGRKAQYTLQNPLRQGESQDKAFDQAFSLPKFHAHVANRH